MKKVVKGLMITGIAAGLGALVYSQAGRHLSSSLGSGLDAPVASVSFALPGEWTMVARDGSRVALVNAVVTGTDVDAYEDNGRDRIIASAWTVSTAGGNVTASFDPDALFNETFSIDPPHLETSFGILLKGEASRAQAPDPCSTPLQERMPRTCFSN
jgi:hypothetical protein